MSCSIKGVLGKLFIAQGVLDKLIFIPITVCSYNRLFSMTSQGSLLHSFGQKKQSQRQRITQFANPVANYLLLPYHATC